MINLQIERLFLYSPDSSGGEKRPTAINQCLEQINIPLRICGIPLASREQLSAPVVLISTDHLTTAVFGELGISDIPILALSDPRERHESGPIVVSVTDDIGKENSTSTKFNLSGHLPLLSEPVSLLTPKPDYHHRFNPMHYDDERYFAFDAIPDRKHPFIQSLWTGLFVSIKNKPGEKFVTIIIVDTRYPASNGERDVTFFSATIQRNAVGKAIKQLRAPYLNKSA